MKNYSLFIIIFILFINCSSDDSSDDSKDLFVVNDFTVTMDENPSQNQLIGTIPYEVKREFYTVRSFVTSINVSDAIYIIENSIYVNDPILFDFEINPIIVANVRVEKGTPYFNAWTIEDTKTITLTINLNNLPD